MSTANARKLEPDRQPPVVQSVSIRSTANKKTRGKRYMPLKLKMVLARHGLRQADWQNAIIQDRGRGAGKPVSSSAGTQLLNWGVWPKLTDINKIKSQTESFLRDNKVPDDDIATVWEIDHEDKGRGAHPSGVHAGQRPGKKRQSPFIDELPEAEMLSQKAKNHFHIFRDPFIDDIQRKEDVYLSTDQRYIAEAMFHTVKHGGFLAVVGESGAGKSTLRRAMLERIQSEGLAATIIQPRVFDKGRLTTGLICEAIIGDLSNDRPRQSLERKARQVEHLLTGSSRAGNNHVLLIEEAHDLTIKTLKYLKRFWEMEDGFKKLLSIILIGQPELKDKLDERQNWDAREIIQRCEIAELRPLNGNLEEYLSLKFNRIDKSLDEVFDTDAFDALRERLTIRRRGQQIGDSMLYPLRVNNAVTKAMNLAANIGAPTVNADIVKEV
ncbi:MAG: AAA family ATPase [Pseudomonadota bacterium]|nr:AAA family ATPase [Pseudomonadota bacterium]